MDPSILKKLAVDGKVDVELLNQISHVQSSLRVERRLLDEAKKRHKHEIEVIEGVIRKIQFHSCGHQAKTHYGDPSGGSDSHTTCDICGLEL